MARQPAEARRKEGLDQLPCGPLANHKAAEAEDIEMVILHPLAGRKSLMDQAGPGSPMGL